MEKNPLDFSEKNMLELLELTLANDAPARDELIIRVWDMASGIVVYMLKKSGDPRDRHQAEDLANDIVCKIFADNGRCLRLGKKKYENLVQSGESPEGIECYVATTIYRCIYDYYKKKKKDRHVFFPEIYSPPERKRPAPELSLSVEEKLVAGIAGLKDNYRTALMLWRDGLKVGDIAKRMGRDHSTVSYYLKKALEELRNYFGDGDIFPTD